MKGLPVIGPADGERPGRHAGVGHAARALRLAPARPAAGAGHPLRRARLSHHLDPEPGHRRVRARQSRPGVASRVLRRRARARAGRDVRAAGPRADAARSRQRGPRSVLSRPGGAGDRRAHGGRRGSSRPTTWPAHRGEWGEPIATTYRGVTVYETPPPTQGITALMALNMLEGVPARRRYRCTRAEHLHLLAGDHQAGLRRPRSLDRRSGSGARAGRGAARQGVRRRAAEAVRSPQGGRSTVAGRPRRRHHRLRRRRRAGQHRAA